MIGQCACHLRGRLDADAAHHHRRRFLLALPRDGTAPLLAFSLIAGSLQVVGALSIHYRRYLIHAVIALQLPESRPRFKDQGSQTSAPSIASLSQANHHHLESFILAGQRPWRTSSDASTTGFCAYSGMPFPIVSVIVQALVPGALSDASISSTSIQGKSKAEHDDAPKLMADCQLCVGRPRWTSP
jgi:hypothetical protein